MNIPATMFRATVLSLVCVCFAITSVKAEMFLWRDNPSGIELTFPDTWAKAHNQKPDDMVTMQAPGSSDYASCRLRKRSDKRFEMYPYHYDRSIQHVYYGFDFWQDYVSEYSGTILNRVQSDRSFLNTIAGKADFTFLSQAGPKTLMRGFAYSALEDAHIYIFECSAEYDAYDDLYPIFQSILKSVKKDLDDSMFDNENYRRFQDDWPLIIKGKTELDNYR